MRKLLLTAISVWLFLLVLFLTLPLLKRSSFSQTVQSYAFKAQQIASSTELDLFAGGSNQNIVQIPSGTGTVLAPTAYTTWYADQFLTGSTTGGIQEAYTACQTASTTNPSGCRVNFSKDVTISAGGTVTVTQGKPLYIELNGHTMNLSCSSGACMTWSASVAGGSANVTLEHGQVQYTGGSGSSVSEGILVSGTDYMAVRDVTFGPQSGTHATIANWMLLSNAEDNLFENVNFINGQNPILLGTGSGGTTPGSITLFERCTFNGNAKPIQIVSATSQVFFMHDDWEANSSQTLVNIDNSSGQNIAMIRFEDNVFGVNGDGTSSTKLFTIKSAALQADSQILFDHNTFTAGSQGANATIYAFTGGGTPNFYFYHERNLYNGPFGAMFSGWASGQFNVSQNEQCSNWSCTDQGDVLINSPANASGAITLNGYLGDQSTPATAGFIRLADGDTIDFRNHANSANVVGISKNTSDQINIGSLTGTNLGRTSFAQETNLAEASNCASGDFALSAGWNSPSSCTVASNSKDQAGLITWVNGSSPTANPTVTLTFHDGTFTQRPFCQAWFQDNTSVVAATAFMSGTNTTVMVAKYIGTPTGSDTFQLQWFCPTGIL